MGVDEVFKGRTPDHTPGHMVRCILEAVASSLREQVTVLSGGVLPSEIRSAGGGGAATCGFKSKPTHLEYPSGRRNVLNRRVWVRPSLPKRYVRASP